MMTNGKTALWFAHRAADLAEAKRPIDVKLTRARLQGAAELASQVLDTGCNEFGIIDTLQTWVRDNPRPAPGAFPTARKVWDAKAVVELKLTLEAL